MKYEMVDFVFEYEVKQRELDCICLVAAYLINKGFTVAFINSWQCLEERPKPYSAKVAVIPAGYDDGTYNFFTKYIAKFEKVVNFQWEQIRRNYFYRHHQNESIDYSGTGCKIRHICWGNKSKEWMNRYFGIQDEYLYVAGYLPLDFYRSEISSLLISKDELFGKYNLDTSQKTLLFVSSFSFVGLPDTEPHGNDMYYNLSLSHFIQMQHILIEWFEKFAALHPDYQLIYRYHPAEKNNPEIERMVNSHSNIYAINSERLNHWIAACDKIYNCYSTSMIEMMYSGKDTYLCRPIPLPHEIDIPIFENAHCITTYNDFETSAIESQMLSFPVDSNCLLQWYDINDYPVYARIGDYLIDTYYDVTYNSRPASDNVFKHILSKKIKRMIKNSLLFQIFSDYCISHMGRNQITDKLRSIEKNKIQEQRYYQELNIGDSYIRKKIDQNKVSDNEIEKKINKCREILGRNKAE